ncbi:phosphoenolpyruvate synthase [Nocardia pneumoniae]|uniref:phosphoenolpyruvate synthase n=1 Tax=Nocardia pneumoniae TaxID=228601 RepID=UPI00030148DE|nr:phosphoenolpyruvate synthase [Nocardia pneumoniae]
MSEYIIHISELPDRPLRVVGGKARNLGELISADQSVPDGFCLTTEAFRRFLDSCPDVEELYSRLDNAADDAERARIGAEFRKRLGEIPVPEHISLELCDQWHRVIDGNPCAVRSSATAEDLRTASFAGQYDTFLNVTDERQLLDCVRRCWLSVFTDRAIDYRRRRGIGHRDVELAVIVQRMADATVAGVMFTADPVSGRRGVTVINAAFGLGESVVSGAVSPDLYSLDSSGVLHKSISTKTVITKPLPGGGVENVELATADRRAQALPDNEIRELAALGRRLEAYFGSPQDIEWARTGTGFLILQSRPITSLFPTPPPPADGWLHLYFSFGHQQMMTEAISPLGQSVLRTYFPFGRRLPSGESSQMTTAGDRVFFDYTAPLHSPLARRVLSWAVGSMDARVGQTVREFAARTEFQRGYRTTLRREAAINIFLLRAGLRVLNDLCWSNLNERHAAIHRFRQRSLATARARVGSSGGAKRIAAIQADMHAVAPRIVDQLVIGPMSALLARQLIERLVERWLGDTTDVGALDKSLPGNITTEMGLVLADLADSTRDNPALREILEDPPEEFELAMLDTMSGGPQFRKALEDFLAHFGMRGPGEIDIARPRWIDRPTLLFTSILAASQTSFPGEHRTRFVEGARAADTAIDRILGRVRSTRNGRIRARILSRLIRVHRTLMALREHQKFLTVGLFDIYRTGIRAEVESLVATGVLESAADGNYLSLHELRGLLSGRAPDDLAEVIRARKSEFEVSMSLQVPRLLASDGEMVAIGGSAVPTAGTLVGSPVSAGVVEGRARVVLRPEQATFEDGDILVAPFADPAWTPLFSAVRGVVLEVGGVMAHGAVVARELGLPAVVGIDNATTLITDGQRIRVDGSLGTVCSLSAASADVVRV